MKTKTNQANSRGSALLVTLLTTTIMGIALASYLTLVANQNRSIARSLTWNMCVPVMEAGVEEALTHIYHNGITNLSTEGWTLSASGLYTKTRSIAGDGSYCELAIQPVEPPVIFSTGYVKAPANPFSAVGMIAGTVPALSASAPGYVARKVRVTTTRAKSPGGGGISAKAKISFSGGGMLDSFDSSDPAYSTSGKYDPAKRKAGAIALTNLKTPDAVHVDSAHIFGTVITGPGGTVTTAGGAVGDAGWNSTQSGVQPGHSADDANVQFNDEQVPFTSGYSTPGSGYYGPTNATYLLGSGNYKISGSPNISGGKSMIVTGDAVLHVEGDFIASGSGYVYIAPGASLSLYVNGKFSISGTGVMNGTDLASKFNVHGLNSCTTVNYSGGTAFIGTVNAPYAAFTFSGSAGAYGSFSANTISVNGGASIHYDEDLTPGKATGYVVASWNEL